MDIPFSGHKDNKRNILLASASCIIEKAMLYARRITYDDTKKGRVNGVSIGHDDI